MREKLTEGLKRNIYYELATHDVIVERPIYWKDRETRTYTFGCYRVDYLRYDFDEEDAILKKYNSYKKYFVPIDISDECFDDPEYEAWKIYVAAKNKAAGKRYRDPYNMPPEKAIQDSQKRFAKYPTEFLPYDIPKNLQQKIVTEMKQVLVNNLNEYYNGKER